MDQSLCESLGLIDASFKTRSERNTIQNSTCGVCPLGNHYGQTVHFQPFNKKILRSKYYVYNYSTYRIYTLWQSNVAMDNSPFIDFFPLIKPSVSVASSMLNREFDWKWGAQKSRGYHVFPINILMSGMDPMFKHNPTKITWVSWNLFGLSFGGAVCQEVLVVDPLEYHLGPNTALNEGRSVWALGIVGDWSLTTGNIYTVCSPFGIKK